MFSLENASSNETRQKIFHAAYELFSRYGYAGTSIRQIAQESGANLAAVNYYFHNKETLFWNVMASCCDHLRANLKIFYEESSTLKEMALKSYDFMSQENAMMKNAFKMLLTEGIAPPNDKNLIERVSDEMGPPGGIYFSLMIERELGAKLDTENLSWGVRTLFGAMNFWLLLCHSESLPIKTLNLQSDKPKLSNVRQDVADLADSVLHYLKLKNQSK